MQVAFRRSRRWAGFTAFLFLLPSLLLILIFQIYPFIKGVEYAFRDIELVRPTEGEFVGLRNFIIVLRSATPRFWTVVLNSMVFTAGSIAGQIGLGLFFAILLHQRWVKGRNVFRSIFLIPWVIAGVIVGYTWRFVYDPRAGLLNRFLIALGIMPTPWLISPRTVMIAAIVTNIWRGVGFDLLVQLAGLQSIDLDLLDAAAVDGASGTQLIYYIVLPLLKPFLLISLIVDTIATLNLFDLIFILTGGGPMYRTEVMSLYMYHLAFDQGYLGRGSAVSVILLLITLGLVMLYIFLFEEEAARV